MMKLFGLFVVVVSCSDAFVLVPQTKTTCSLKAAASYAEEIESAKTVLLSAAETRKEESDKVVDSLLRLEKACRERARQDPSSSEALMEKLDGSWRLCYTTGTVDAQKRTGRVNYFPLKAVQSFDFSSKTIENGIYLFDTPALRFKGFFDFDTKNRKLEFDFDTLSLFGFDINLGKKGAANIGKSTGLGSKSNADLLDKGKKPFFMWIDADDAIATARGGGGGLALWKRETS